MGSVSAGDHRPAGKPVTRRDRLVAASLLTIVVVPFTGHMAAGAPRPTGSLCLRGEEPLFSCPVRERIASVCGRGGEAVYRFGHPSRIELQARGLTNAERAFSGAGETQIAFENNGSRYVIYDRLVRTSFGAAGHHDPQATAGVIVRKGGKLVSNATCDGSGGAGISPTASKYMSGGAFVPR